MVRDEVAVDKLYQEHEDPWYLSWRAVQQMRYQKYITMLTPYFKQNSTFLDIGCGRGYFFEHLLRANSFSQLVGVDISSHAVNQARALFCKHNNVFFEVGKLPNAACSGKQFDIVAALEVIYYLESREDREQAFVNIYNLVKSGGHALISVNIGQDCFYEDVFMDYLDRAGFVLEQKAYIRDSMYLRAERRLCHVYDVLKDIARRRPYSRFIVSIFKYFVKSILRSRNIAKIGFFFTDFSKAEPNILFVLVKKV